MIAEASTRRWQRSTVPQPGRRAQQDRNDGVARIRSETFAHMTPIKVWLGRPYPPGAAWRANGVNFALYSEHATAVDLCLFDSVDSPHLERDHRDSAFGVPKSVVVDPAFRRPKFFQGRKIRGSEIKDIMWFNPGGSEMGVED
jgi:Carbohydrate-binding module 48 (Isoamylase N-terminal domain)